MADETNQENIETTPPEDSAGTPSEGQEFNETDAEQTDIPASTELEQVSDGFKTADGRVLETHQEVQEFLDNESRNQQADYTKKTQELARQKETLGSLMNIKDAVEQNPHFAAYYRKALENYNPDDEQGNGDVAIQQVQRRIGMMELNQEVEGLQSDLVKRGQPRMTTEEVNDLARFATKEGGISLKKARKLFNYDKDFADARLKGAQAYKEELKKQKQSGNRVPPTHSPSGSLKGDAGEKPVFKSTKDVGDWINEEDNLFNQTE